MTCKKKQFLRPRCKIVVKMSNYLILEFKTMYSTTGFAIDLTNLAANMMDAKEVHICKIN